MPKVNGWDKLLSQITDHLRWVIYKPLADEPDPLSLPFVGEAKTFFTPKNKVTNPADFAQTLTKNIGPFRTGVIIPGRQFDWRGHRRGRGGGWYDRFLASIPSSWLRLGLTKPSAITKELIPKPWDQSVDWLIWFDGEWWAHETNARPER